MDRIWFLTWHTYGTWLPGDSRGFVTTILNAENVRMLLNVPGTETADDNPRLREYAKSVMKGVPIHLTLPMAESLADQLHETSKYRQWKMLGFAIICTHVHLVVGVKSDPEPEKVLGDFKAYGSRKLNGKFGKPTNGTWWVESGSKRKVKGQIALLAVLDYVCRRQANPLVVWIDPAWAKMLEGERSA